MLPKLAVAQLAIALCLANLAILMLLSYRRVLDSPQGFDEQRVLTADVFLVGEPLSSNQNRRSGSGANCWNAPRPSLAWTPRR